MRPLRLTMTAFGPYGGRQEIDFTRLEQHPIFLITGPTGAGKTTVFDGICYALYGEASGAGRDGENLRSQFAPLEVLTQVGLTFRLRGQYYEIHRIPRQEKAKSRGGGTTIQNPEATLQIGNGEGAKIITGVSSVKEKIHEILGMNCKQFRHIMMIPQGEFRQLLTADSREREEILQQIFDTVTYKELERVLNEMAGELKESLARSKEETRLYQGSLDREGHLELEALLATGNPPLQALLPVLALALETDRAGLKEMAELRHRLGMDQQDQQRRVLEGEHHNRQLAEKQVLWEQYQRLEALGQSMVEKAEKLEQGRQALLLVPLENQVQEAAGGLEASRKEHDRLAALLEQLNRRLEQARSQAEAERERAFEIEAMKEELDRLKGYREQVTQLEGQETESRKQKALLEQQEKVLRQAKDQVEGQRQQLKEDSLCWEKLRQQELRGAQVKMEILEGEQRRERLFRLKEEKEKLYRLGQAYKKERAGYEQAEQRFVQLRSRLEALQETWMRGQAGVLAAGLLPGQPCPVCGGLDHPLPAAQGGTIPQEQELRQEKELLEAAEGQVRECLHRFKAIEAQGKAQKEWVQQLTVQVEQDLQISLTSLDRQTWEAFAAERLAALEQELKQYRLEEAAIQQGQQQFQELSQGLEKLKAELEAGEKRVEDTQKLVLQLTAAYEGQRGASEALKAQLPEGIRQPGKLEAALLHRETAYQQRRKQLQATEEAYQQSLLELEKGKTALAHGAANRAQKLGALEAAQLRFQEALVARGFLQEDAYRAVRLSEGEMKALETELVGYRQQRELVKAQYQALEEATAQRPAADMEALNRRLAELQEENSRLEGRYGRLTARTQRNQELMEKLTVLQERQEVLEEKYGLVGHLATVAKGNNHEMMSFERYVLASFLDQILEAANDRLLKMTEGRYLLSRTVERSRANAQSGLELEIFDHYTGRSRHVKTLSGGESFKASLALALGLADVVQAHAGGFSLETIFIDEGFGTLDSESLDTAIETLGRLQLQGRLVGIISHVPELKERIEAKLIIKATAKGSTAAFSI